MTVAMECEDSRRGVLDTGDGEWRVATTILVAASAAPVQGGSRCGREEPLCGARAHSGQWWRPSRSRSCCGCWRLAAARPSGLGGGLGGGHNQLSHGGQ